MSLSHPQLGLKTLVDAPSVFPLDFHKAHRPDLNQQVGHPSGLVQLLKSLLAQLKLLLQRLKRERFHEIECENVWKMRSLLAFFDV